MLSKAEQDQVFVQLRAIYNALSFHPLFSQNSKIRHRRRQTERALHCLRINFPGAYDCKAEIPAIDPLRLQEAYQPIFALLSAHPRLVKRIKKDAQARRTLTAAMR
jgi:hypothetical protein